MAKDFVGDYAASRRPFGNPVGVDANTNAMDDEVAGMLATLRRLREQRQAREREAAMAFPKPEGPEAAAPTSSAMAKFGSSPAAAEASMRAAQEEEEHKAFWSAVEAGSTPAIDAALDATGQSAEMLRQRKAALEMEAKKYESERDPALRARARQVFEAEYKSLADDEKTVQEYQDRVIKGIAARQAGNFQASAEMDSIDARYGKVAMLTLARVWKWMDKITNASAGQVGTWFDVATGQGLPDATFAIPVVGAFMEPTQRRGEVFRQELGSALAGTFRGEGEGAEGLVSKYNPWSLTVRGANALGTGLVNLGEAQPVDAATDPLGAAAAEPVRMLGKAYGAAADFVSGAKTPEERATKYMDATAQVIADTILDPTSFINLPLGRILGKALKPLEPLLEGALKRAGTTKYNARTALASLAGKIRAYTRGGLPLEDPDFAALALKSEAARVAYSKDLHLAAMEHRAKIEGKLAAIPPELREDVQARVVPELLERVPKDEWKGAKLQSAEIPSIDSESRAASTARAAEALRPNNERVLVELDDSHIQKALADGRIPVRRMEGYVKIADPEKAARVNALQGTYYYFDPSSSEYLPVGRVLDAVDKVDAAMKLGIGRSTIAKRLGISEAELAPGIGRFSKELNVDIRRLAERQGYDAVLLRSVSGGPGGRATTEVIDLMPRDYSVARIVDEQGKPAAASLRAKGEIDRKILTSVQEARKAVSKALPWLTPEAIHKWFPWADINPGMQRSLFAIQDMFRFLDAVDYAVSPKWLDTEVRSLLESANLDAQTFDIARRALNRAASAARVVTHYKRAVIEPREVMRIWGKVVVNSRDPAAARVMARELGDLEPSLARYADAVAPKPKSDTPSPAYEAALKNIPPQHRAAVTAYVSSIADANEARKVLLAARGINVELADDVLLGYANRRWSPEFQFWLAKHPEVTAALGELKLAQHYNATGQAIPDTNQFAKRKFRAETFDEAEEILRQKFGYTGRDIWDRNWRDVVVGDMLFAANAARRKADFDTFLEVFAKKGSGEYDKGMMSVGELAKRLRMEIPPQYADMMVSRNQANTFLKNNVPDDPSVLRQRINRITNWVSRSVLATPGSVTKDIKGQIINAAITDPRIFAYLDQSFAAIKKGVPDGDLAILEARGLARPSFEAEIAPSTIAAAREFGGSAAAATIEESGFVGGAIRGLGAAAKKVPAIGAPVGKALEKTGRAIGAVGRASLTVRQTSEEVFRLATYKAAKARGLSQEEALLEVAKYWGDFSQLSKLEKGVLKGFVLFFSWQLRALKIGVHQIVDHPFRTRLFLSLTAGDVADREDFPIWARRQGGTVIGKDDAGNPKFISLAAGSYFDPLSEVLQGEAMQRMRTDGLKGVVAGLAQQGLRRLAPMFQAPIEYATNYDSFSGSQIRLEDRQDTKTRTSDHAPAAALWLPEPMKKFLGVEPVYDSKTGALSYVRMDPTLNWLFNKTMPGVGAQLAGTLNPAADPRKSTLEAVGRGVLGTPTYSVRPVDMTGVAKEKVRAAQEALRRSLDRTGLAMNSDGAVRFDDRTDLGRAMLADNERWVREARDLGYSAEGYVRFKMANKYEEALRLIDLANRLRFADEAVAGESLRPAKPLKGLSDESTANLSPRVLGLQQRQDQSRRNRLRSLGGPR